LIYQVQVLFLHVRAFKS